MRTVFPASVQHAKTECQSDVLQKENIVLLFIIVRTARFTAKPESSFEKI
jgi:hypothetical protein